MHTTKKLVAIFLVGIMILATVGCGSSTESAEQAVINMLDAVKASDSEKASQYIDYDKLVNAGEKNEEKNDVDLASSAEMMKLVFQNISYQIISSKEEGDKATVNVEITNVDMSAILEDFISQAFSLAFSGTSEEQMETKMMEIFKELMSSKENKMLTNEVEISLNKEDDQWKIKMSDELMDAIFGGMISAMEDMKDSFGGGTGEDQLSEIDGWLISDIWNDGLCNIDWYTNSGTDSEGRPLDIDFTLQQLDTAMKKKPDYDKYINGLTGEEYAQVKQIWEKLSPELDRLYEQIQTNKPVAEDSGTAVDTDIFTQYQEAFSDAVDALD